MAVSALCVLCDLVKKVLGLNHDWDIREQSEI